MNMSKSIRITGMAAAVSVAGFGIGSNLPITDFGNLSSVKWGSVIVAIVVALFFVFKHEVLAFENLEEGERGYRRRWGKIVTNRKTGERTLLYPGKRHFYIKKVYDIAVTSVRVHSSPDKPGDSDLVKGTVSGKNILFVLVVKWSVEDTEESIYRSLTSVFQVNRAREGDKALENYVLNEVKQLARSTLSEFDKDSEGLPVITIDSGKGTVPAALKGGIDSLRRENGVVVGSIGCTTLSDAPESNVRATLRFSA